jgi:hypothetical protein
MSGNRIILGMLALLAILAVHAPAALAGGPLLSGYGGPGAGAQAIIGGTLLNGPSGGSGGGSGGSSGGSSSPGSSSSSSSSSSLPTGASGVATGGGGQAASGGSGSRGASPSPRHGGGRDSASGGPSTGSTGASSPSHPEASEAASVSAGASWFTGGDLLALALAAGVLALVVVATVRLSGMGAHHG